MLITITRTVQNQVFKATVATEANSLELDFMRAYGEPRVDSGGTLTFDTDRAEQSALNTAILGVTQDLRTNIYYDPDLLDETQIHPGDTITITGVVNEPALNGTFTIAAVDQIHHAFAVESLGLVDMNPFMRDVSIGTATIGAEPIQYEAFDGFADDGTDLVLQLRPDHTLDLATVVGLSMTVTGMSLEPGLNGTFLITDADPVANTLTIASLGLSSVAQFQVEYPQGNLLVRPAPESFAAPVTNLYIRSGSPFVFSVDGRVDASAESKTISWARDLRDKIVSATLSLKQNPNPRQYPILETTEI